MIKVKHFICGASHASLEYFDEDINRWMEKNNVRTIKNVQEFYGQSPVGMSGHPENVIFISLWYECEAEADGHLAETHEASAVAAS